eukprot:6499668-Karenia_brevis.AAC.1
MWIIDDQTHEDSIEGVALSFASDSQDQIPVSPDKNRFRDMFPIWSLIKDSAADIIEKFLVKTRMKDKKEEASLADPGSPENLVGEQRSQRQRSECKKAGYVKSDHPLEVGGVGSGFQIAVHRVTHAIGLGMVTKQNTQHQKSQAVECLHCWDSAH